MPARLPFSYATRNLLRDPARLAQKVIGSAAVVFLVIAAGAFNHGMNALLAASGSDRNVILLGAGSEESIERSQIPMQTEVLAAGIAGVEHRLGVPAVSGEVHYMGNVTVGDAGERQALLRGVTVSAFEVHRSVRILDGRFPQAGEIMVGRLAHHSLGLPQAALAPGRTLRFEGQAFTIAATFAAPGSVMESEIWINRNDLMTLTQRDSLSCVIVRLRADAPPGAVDLFTKQRLDLELSAMPETHYYARLAAFYAPIRAMTWLTAALIAAGAVFGGFNMLYAAFASRIREIATLQAVGFSRASLLESFIQESLVATLLGTLLAALGALLLLDGLTVNFSMATFSMQLHGAVIGAGLIAGIALGTLGAIPPALSCLLTPLPSALRS